MIWAAISDRTGVLHTLLAHGADPDATGQVCRAHTRVNPCVRMPKVPLKCPCCLFPACVLSHSEYLICHVGCPPWGYCEGQPALRRRPASRKSQPKCCPPGVSSEPLHVASFVHCPRLRTACLLHAACLCMIVLLAAKANPNAHQVRCLSHCTYCWCHAVACGCAAPHQCGW